MDCFCYLGAFSFYALKTGAKRATLVDTSEKALSLAEEIAKLNHWKQKILILKTDVFQFLKNMKETIKEIIRDGMNLKLKIQGKNI